MFIRSLILKVIYAYQFERQLIYLRKNFEYIVYLSTVTKQNSSLIHIRNQMAWLIYYDNNENRKRRKGVVLNEQRITDIH